MVRHHQGRVEGDEEFGQISRVIRHRGCGILVKLTYQNSCRRQVKVVRHHLKDGEAEEPDQT